MFLKFFCLVFVVNIGWCGSLDSIEDLSNEQEAQFKAVYENDGAYFVSNFIGKNVLFDIDFSDLSSPIDFQLFDTEVIDILSTSRSKRDVGEESTIVTEEPERISHGPNLTNWFSNDDPNNDQYPTVYSSTDQAPEADSSDQSSESSLSQIDATDDRKETGAAEDALPNNDVDSKLLNEKPYPTMYSSEEPERISHDIALTNRFSNDDPNDDQYPTVYSSTDQTPEADSFDQSSESSLSQIDATDDRQETDAAEDALPNDDVDSKLLNEKPYPTMYSSEEPERISHDLALTSWYSNNDPNEKPYPTMYSSEDQTNEDLSNDDLSDDDLDPMMYPPTDEPVPITSYQDILDKIAESSHTTAYERFLENMRRLKADLKYGPTTFSDSPWYNDNVQKLSPEYEAPNQIEKYPTELMPPELDSPSDNDQTLPDASSETKPDLSSNETSATVRGLVGTTADGRLEKDIYLKVI